MIQEILDKIAEIELKAIDGDIECCNAYAKFKQIEKRIEHALENVHLHAINEVNRVGIDNKYQKYGATFQYISSGKFDFSGVKIVEEKKTQLKNLEAKILALHKTQENGEMIVDVDTGELYERPVYKPNKPTLKVTFDKK